MSRPLAISLCAALCCAWVAVSHRTVSASAGSNTDLLRAFLQSDRDRIARAGQAAGAAGLSPDLQSPDRATVLAASAASPWADDGWFLLSELAQVAALPDRSLAASAARSAVAISLTLNPARLSEQEIPIGDLRRRLSAWQTLALDRSRWPDIRVNALEVSVRLRRALGKRASDVALDLVAMSDDPDPEIRRATLELLPQPLDAEARDHAALILLKDGNPVVAAVAGQTLCGGLWHGDPAEPVLRAIGPAGMARLRDLLENPVVPDAALVDSAQCLLAEPSPQNNKALAGLKRRAPKYMRKLLIVRAVKP